MFVKTCVVAALLCLASALPRIGNINSAGRIPGEFLITLRQAPRVQKAAFVQSTVAKIVARTSAVVLAQFDALESPILHVHAEDQAISKAFEIPEVVSIEANVFQKAITQCSSQSTGITYWGLSRTSSRGEPDYSDAQYSYPSNAGDGVTVYVLDTGVSITHEDFSGGRAEFGANTIGGSDDDNHGHGTHCAGTVLGGNSGLAKQARAVGIKVVNDQGSGSVANFVDGINWAIADSATRGRCVISLSLRYLPSDAIDSAVTSAATANIPVVAGAGNENLDACIFSPGRAPAVITVGAIDQEETLASFSNWGTCVDLLAPGTAIRSAQASNDSGYVTMSGTSMATPHVAGAAAVYLSANPEATPEQVRSALTSQGSPNFIDLRGTSGTPNINLYVNC